MIYFTNISQTHVHDIELLFKMTDHVLSCSVQTSTCKTKTHYPSSIAQLSSLLITTCIQQQSQLVYTTCFFYDSKLRIILTTDLFKELFWWG